MDESEFDNDQYDILHMDEFDSSDFTLMEDDEISSNGDSFSSLFT